MRVYVNRILSWTTRHRLLVLVAAPCLAIAAAAAARGLSFDDNVLSLLPQSGRAIPAFREYFESFGSVDQLYVVFTAPSGHAISEYEDVVDAWSRRLRESPEIAHVNTGLVDRSRDLTWLGDRRLLLLDDERLQVAIARFTGAGSHEILQMRRAMLAVPSPSLADLVRHDPLGFFDLLRDQLGGAQAGANLGMTETGYVTADGRSRLLEARPVKPSYDAEFADALMNRLAAIRAEVASETAAPRDDGEFKPPPQIELAGGHVIAVETADMVRDEAIWNSVTSLVLILPLLYAVFRSAWLVVVGPIPTALSLIMALGALGLARTTLSTAAAASAAMLFGLGVDGVVLIYVSYTVALREGRSPDEAIAGLTGPSASMLTGMWTTAATFYGLMVVDFPSLEQLGAIIGHSMLFCGVLTLVLIPALLPRRPPKSPPRLLTMSRFAEWTARRSRFILVSAAVATIVLAAAAMRLHVNPTLERLQSVTPGAAVLQRIGPMFGHSIETLMVMTRGKDLDALLGANERLRSNIARTLPQMPLTPPTLLLPSAATQVHRQALLRTAALTPAAALKALEGVESKEGFTPGSFDPFRERLPELLDTEHRVTYDAYVSHGLGDLIGRLVTRVGDEWRLVTYAYPSNDREIDTLQAVVATSDPSAVLTGLAIVNRELARGFLRQFVTGLTVGTVIVVLILLIEFRDVRYALLSLVPTAIGLIWAAGLLGLAGATLDLFALFAVVTFVGIGVDYGIHLVHRAGDGRRAVADLAPVILIAGAITVSGYGTLVNSSYPPLRSIGVVSIVSVVTLVAAALFVLPAILEYLKPRLRP